MMWPRPEHSKLPVHSKLPEKLLRKEVVAAGVDAARAALQHRRVMEVRHGQVCFGFLLASYMKQHSADTPDIAPVLDGHELAHVFCHAQDAAETQSPVNNLECNHGRVIMALLTGQVICLLTCLLPIRQVNCQAKVEDSSPNSHSDSLLPQPQGWNVTNDLVNESALNKAKTDFVVRLPLSDLLPREHFATGEPVVAQSPAPPASLVSAVRAAPPQWPPPPPPAPPPELRDFLPRRSARSPTGLDALGTLHCSVRSSASSAAFTAPGSAPAVMTSQDSGAEAPSMVKKLMSLLNDGTPEGSRCR